MYQGDCEVSFNHTVDLPCIVQKESKRDCRQLLLVAIDRMHKYMAAKKYSFVYVLISLTSLVCMDKIPKKCCLKARLVSLIT